MTYGKDYFGFIYIWYNRTALQLEKSERSNGKKHPRLYIGSHLGAVDDGYICSSSWMLKSYKKNPSKFMRRIVFWLREDDLEKLRDAENCWLSKIKKEELGTRFYNLTRNSSRSEQNVELHKANTKKRWEDPAYRERLSKTHKERWANTEYRAMMSIVNQRSWDENPERKVRFGQTLRKKIEENPEIRVKLSDNGKNNWANNEIREKMLSSREEYWKDNAEAFERVSKQAKTQWANPDFKKDTSAKIGAALKGRKHSPECIEKMRAAHTGKKQPPEQIAARVAKNKGQKRSPELREKMKESQRLAWLKRKKDPEAMKRHSESIRAARAKS